MPKYSDEEIRRAVESSDSWAGACRFLNIQNPSTGSQTHIKRRASKLSVDSSHFTGQSWRKGRVFDFERKPIEFYTVLNGPFITSHNLKIKLFRSGAKRKECESCGISEWMGEDMPLELDHINSNRVDNRLENLMILCPNCHAVKTRKDSKRRVVNREQQTA